MQQQKLGAPTAKETGNKTEAKRFCMKKHDPQCISREDKSLLPVENKCAMSKSSRDTDSTAITGPENSQVPW